MKRHPGACDGSARRRGTTSSGSSAFARSPKRAPRWRGPPGRARARLDAAALSLDAARVRRDAAKGAAADAEARFEVGTGDAADVSLALGDALDATVDLARAEARQALAVEALRVAAGQPLLLAGGAP